MRADGGSFSPNKEADELRWLPLSQARALLTHERDQKILDEFVRGPFVTRMVLLVRHASAGNRSEWDRDDRLRPLDEKGRLQAEGLVRILSRFEVGEIVSADFVRCVESVQPLADSLGIAIKKDPLLSELGYPNHEEDAVELLRGLGDPEVAAVASTQGEVIPDVLRRLATGGGVRLPDVVEYKKGSTWALSFDDRRLIAADYMAPPAL
jgi:8-oxo-(d)GTP phosphatase